jgi:hypothetical protein
MSENIITNEMRQFAHDIHRESIKIDQDQRLERDIDWEEEYFKVLNIACELADKVLGVK